MPKLVIIGGGGHAKVVLAMIKKLNMYETLGYTDLKNQGDFFGCKYLGTDDLLPDLLQKNPNLVAVLGVGKLDASNSREKIIHKLKEIGLRLPSIVAAGAIVQEGTSIGNASIIMDGVILQSDVRVGDGAIVNTGATVDHDSIIGDFVHIAPGATICGGVEIGKNSFIGVGANILQYKKFPANSILAAGATLIESAEIEGTYIGTPARKK